MEIKDRIVNGAAELFMRYGIKSMTMDDVAKHLGISKKTIYKHFSNKTELLEKIMRIHTHDEQGCVNKIVETTTNAVEQFVMISRHIKSTMMAINPTAILDLQKFYPAVWKYFQEHKNECINNSIFENLEWGKRDGLYRTDFNSEILTILRVEQIELGMNQDIYNASKFSLVEVQMELFHHFMMGILTPKGLELYNKYIENNE